MLGIDIDKFSRAIGLPSPAPTSAAKPVAAPTPTIAADEITLGNPATAAPDTAGVTAEEARYMADNLLPPGYPELKALAEKSGVDAAKALYRKGRQGPFSARVGDPAAMLDYARNCTKNPEFKRLYQEVRKGDMVFLALDTTGPVDPVQTYSKGPFGHVMICVSEAQPPEFIEAIGITGDPKDPTNNHVRRGSAADYTWDRYSMRLVRPTAGMVEPARGEAVGRAIAYAEAQLGKRYDYTFSGTKGDKTFYCSDLVYAAYTRGAGMGFPLNKSGDRDTAVAALQGLIATLKPKDSSELMDGAIRFVEYGGGADPKKLIDYVVDEIMPNCQATQALSKNSEQRTRLKGTILQVLSGKGFPRFDAACRAYNQEAQRSGFKPRLLGWPHQIWMRVEIGVALVRDGSELCAGAGTGRWEALRSAWAIVTGVLPHADTLAQLGFGDKDPRTASVRSLMDRMDWLSETAHRVPLLGRLYPLPGRAKPTPLSTFISPSDVAWSPFWHLDYNVKKDLPLDPPRAK